MNCHLTALSCYSPWFWQVLQHSEVPITGASLPLVAVLVPRGGSMKWSMMRLIALGRSANDWYFLFGGLCLVFCGLHSLKKIHPK